MTLARAAQTSMVVTLAAYLTLIAVGVPTAFTWVRDSLVGGLTIGAVLVLLMGHGQRRRDDRAVTWLLGGGVALYLSSSVYYFVSAVHQSVAFPSPSDLFNLCDAPLLLAGLLVALSRGQRRDRLAVVLDGASGTFAWSAVVAWLAAPVVERLTDGSMSGSATLAYLVVGGVLVVAGLGALTLLDRDDGVQFALLPMGVAVLGINSIVYAVELANDSYLSGHWLDAAGMSALAMIAWGGTHLRPRRRTLPRGRSLTVTALSALAGVVVLSVSAPVSGHPLPGVLALLGLSLCTVRLGLAFAQLRELAVVREQALTDELTGAANRRALYAEMDRLLGAGKLTSSPAGFALALVDLDHFKEVNDSFGHAVGDALLREVVNRFGAALDATGADHLLSRLGGDEFAVILRGIDGPDHALRCGQTLADSLNTPAVLEGALIHPRASFGLSVARLHGDTRADLLFAADAAMYAAKSANEPVRLYAPSVVGDRRGRLEVAEDLIDALQAGELFVEYQPVKSAHNVLAGAEALVRWDHPMRGRVMPDEFLPVAERYRLGHAVTDRVLDLVLNDLAHWRDEDVALICCVNLSASDIVDPRLAETVAAALDKHDVPAGSLVIEITETEMMADAEAARTVMLQLKELGVSIAVDDYGTGYSSLEHLLRLPVDVLKLDRAFCRDLVTDRRAREIVRSTLDLTHALGLHMVAEGVEDGATLDVLRDLGCDLVQGWHLGRPTSTGAFGRLLHQERATAARSED